MATSVPKLDVNAMLDGRYAKVVSESFVKGSTGTLLICGHEYVVPEQQQNLYLELEHFLESQPSMPIFLEGFSGPRSAWPSLAQAKETKSGGLRRLFQRFSKPPAQPGPNDQSWREATALQFLEQKGRVAGVAAAQVFPEYALLQGAEDISLLEAQKQKLKEIDSAIQSALSGRNFNMATGTFLSSTFTTIFYPIVERLEGFVNERLKELLSLRNQFSTDARATAYASALAATAQAAGIDLEGYPSVQALNSALEMERSLDFEAVERERLELVETLARYSEQQLNEQQTRSIHRWLDFAPPNEKALASIYGETPDEDLGLVWLTRLVTISRAFKDHKYSYSQYHVRLKDLMDSLGIPCPETSQLGRYIRYILSAESFDANALVTSELWSLHDELADIFTASATERGILKLGAQIEDLYKYFRLRLPAARVQSVTAGNPSMVQWLEDAYRLEHSLPGGAAADDRQTMAQNAARFVDKALPVIPDFYACAARRSRKLIENVLASGPGTGRVAALVCGRFHLYEILRVLQGQSRFSWAVIGPMSSRDSEQQLLQTWSWVIPGQELSLPDLLGEDSATVG